MTSYFYDLFSVYVLRSGSFFLNLSMSTSQSTNSSRATTTDKAQSSQEAFRQADLAHKENLRAHLPARWVIVLIFALASMLLPFCIDMYISAFPAMAQDLGVTVQGVELTLSLYYIGIALGQLIWGPLADSYGRKGVTSIAFVALTVATILLTQVENIDMFYGLRFIQGFFSAAILIASTSVLRDIYDTREFVSINGIINIIFFVAPFLAPLIGSYIVVLSNWHMIFAFIGGLSLVTTVLFVFTIPETINPAFKRKLNMGHTLGQMWEVATDGTSFWLILIMTMASCMTFTYITMSSGVFQTYYGITPTMFPFLFMINIVGATLFNVINSKLVKKHSPQKLLMVVVVGCLLAGIFNVSAALMEASFPVLVFGCMLTQSLSPLLFLNGIAVFLEIHFKHSGTATSLVNLFRWIMPGVVTIIAQHVDPQRGFTMLFMLGLFSCLTVVFFILYNYCYKRKYAHNVA